MWCLGSNSWLTYGMRLQRKREHNILPSGLDLCVRLSNRTVKIAEASISQSLVITGANAEAAGNSQSTNCTSNTSEMIRIGAVTVSLLVNSAELRSTTNLVELTNGELLGEWMRSGCGMVAAIVAVANVADTATPHAFESSDMFNFRISMIFFNEISCGVRRSALPLCAPSGDCAITILGSFGMVMFDDTMPFTPEFFKRKLARSVNVLNVGGWPDSGAPLHLSPAVVAAEIAAGRLNKLGMANFLATPFGAPNWPRCFNKSFSDVGFKSYLA